MKTANFKKDYHKPQIRKIRLDNEISIQMSSPPPDPPGAPRPPGPPKLPISTGSDNGEFNPL